MEYTNTRECSTIWSNFVNQLNPRLMLLLVIISYALMHTFNILYFKPSPML